MTTTRPIMNHSARPSTTSDPIRVLSVRQPWAGLIVHGFKSLENRDWETSYRGPLAIHASSNDATSAYREFIFDEKAYPNAIPVGPCLVTPRQLAKARELLSGPKSPTREQTGVRRAIIGVVELVDVIPICGGRSDRKIPRSSPGFNSNLSPRLWYHPHAWFAWILANPVALAKPIPCDGKLNLWNLPPRESELLREALDG